MTRLAGSHAVVAGGSQGLGFATARRCLRRGARVSVIGPSSMPPGYIEQLDAAMFREQMDLHGTFVRTAMRSKLRR